MRVMKIWAVRCPWCLVMWPIWKKIESERPELETVFYDYDNDKEKIDKYNIWNILPVAIFFDENDNEINRIEWEVSKKDIEKILDSYEYNNI